MSVNESKEKFAAAKKALEDCKRSIAELQAKADRLQESLPKLSGAVGDAEKEKVFALDSFALNSNKTTEVTLKGAREAYDKTQKKLAETHELAEATARTLKKQESELVRLNNASEMAKRAFWQAVADEIRSKIPEGVISDIQRLIVVGIQTGKTKQFILSELLPNLNPSEYQAIRDELIEKYGIAD